jgi:Tfp pilus assembly protein PilO
VNNLPSLTVPDQSLTVDEIFKRFRKGLPLTIGNTPNYHAIGDEDADIDSDVLLGVNWNTLDISEKHEVIKDSRTNLKKLNDGISYRQKMEKKAATEKAATLQAKLDKLE